MALLQFGTTTSNLQDVPDPSVMQWTLERVSSPDAGRTQDGVMHVEQIALKRKLELAWHNVDFATAQQIVNAALPEYIYVKYFDFQAGSYQTKKFYTGEHSIPVYTFQNNKKIVSNVSFNIIEV